MPKIERIIGREVIDSRGAPTVEAVVVAKDGIAGMAKVPAGISMGSHEAVELRDGDNQRYRGLGVLKAVGNINQEIQAALIGINTDNQAKIDEILIELDGTPNKSRLGANALLAVSIACARVEAASRRSHLWRYLAQLSLVKEEILPIPQMNLINGGNHASNRLSIQEFQILPVGAPNFAEALRMGIEIYFALEDILKQKGFQVEVAKEGGFAPNLTSSEETFEILIQAIERAGYVPGSDAWLGIDAAATTYFHPAEGKYELDGEKIAAVDLAYRYKKWLADYPLISLEDPFAEDNWSEWQDFFRIKGNKIQIVGDDLYATRVERIRQGAEKKAANSVLIKPNQAGTLTETLAAVDAARLTNQKLIISHRSGETEDTFIADLSVATGAGQIKAGAPTRSDRTAKYNRLLTIAEVTGAPLSHELQTYLEQMQKGTRSERKSGDMI